MSLFHLRARRQIAETLRAEHGKGFLESIRLAASIDDATIDGVVAAIPAAVGALGDGTILQAIIDFLKSPLGQEIISMLIHLIIGA